MQIVARSRSVALRTRHARLSPMTPCVVGQGMQWESTDSAATHLAHSGRPAGGAPRSTEGSGHILLPSSMHVRTSYPLVIQKSTDPDHQVATGPFGNVTPLNGVRGSRGPPSVPGLFSRTYPISIPISAQLQMVVKIGSGLTAVPQPHVQYCPGTSTFR